MHKIGLRARNLKDWADLAELLDRNMEAVVVNNLARAGGNGASGLRHSVLRETVKILGRRVSQGMF